MPPAAMSGEDLNPEAPIVAESALRPDASIETTRPSKRQHLKNILGFLEALRNDLDGILKFMEYYALYDNILDPHIDILETLSQVISKELYQQPNTAYSTPQVVLKLLKPALEQLQSYLRDSMRVGSVMSMVENHYRKYCHDENASFLAGANAGWATGAIARIEEGLKNLEAQGDWDPESFAQPPQYTAAWM